MFDAIIEAGKHLGEPAYWLTLLIGLGLATAISLIPGVGSVLMLGIALPLVLMGIHEPAIGIVLLATITGTSNTFDSIPAQLMGIVSSGTQVTFLEGHQLARKGLGAYSLGAVYAVSGIGGIVGALLLLMVIPVIRPFILMVSFGEIAVLALFGILMVALLSHGAMVKGLAAGFFGIVLGTVGTQRNTGIERFTFGVFDLELGLPLVAAILGLMALPEMIDLVTSRTPVAPESSDVSTREVFRGFREGLRRWKIAVRHSLFGAALGAIPGSGAAVVTWLSYGLGIALHRGDRSQFGKGSLDGLLFAESAENAKEAGQALPTLALGIPAATSWALVLVGMMAYGITPGPNILTDHADVVGLIIITFALANLILTILALFVTRQIMRLTMIPYAAVGAAVIPIIVLGAYLSDLVFVTIPVLIIFTAVGLIMKKYGWPRPPLVLAFILAPVIEDNFFTAVSVYGVRGFATRPLTIALAIIVVATVIFLQVKMKQGMAGPESELVPLEVDHAVVATTATGETAVVVAPAGVATDTVDEAAVTETSAPANVPSTAVEVALDPDPGDEPKTATGWADQLRMRLQLDNLVPAAFAAAGVYALVQASGYHSSRAALLPMFAASCLTVFAVVQLFLQLRHPSREQGQIMDLGMRSSGAEGAKNAGIIVAVILAIYVAGIWIIGLKYSGLIFAALIPIALMKGWKRYGVAAISVALVAAFTFGVADGLFHIFWPDSLLMWP